MRHPVISLVVAAAITAITPYAASAGPNGIDNIKLYQLNMGHSVAPRPNVNLDRSSTGSVSSIPCSESTKRRGRGRQ